MISKFFNIGCRKLANCTGFYSKKQAEAISIDVGKELIDIVKSGKELTQDTFQAVIKKHVPSAKLNIITSEEELKKFAENSGINETFLNKFLANTKGCYFNISGTLNAIYSPKLSCINNTVAIFAHEFEHYLYNKHTSGRATSTMHSILNALKNKYPELVKIDLRQMPLVEMDIQTALYKFFGVDVLNKTGGLSGLKPGIENFVSFLKGENYKGLSDDKRLSAYIRAITRNKLHPNNKESFLKIFVAKSTLEDESRAYNVSSEVWRYATGIQDTMTNGFFAQLCKKTADVLKNELRHAASKYQGREVKTGLPPAAYVGKHD